MVTIILLASATLAQSPPGSQELSANELARRVVANELKFQDEDHAQWAYRQEKEEAGKKQARNRSRESLRQKTVLSADSWLSTTTP
jgi:hypothetical protein